MNQSEGFVMKCQENKVYKLVKSLYGLKQAPKQWHEKSDNTLLSTKFRIDEYDKYVMSNNTKMPIPSYACEQMIWFKWVLV